MRNWGEKSRILVDLERRLQDESMESKNYSIGINIRRELKEKNLEREIDHDDRKNSKIL